MIKTFLLAGAAVALIATPAEARHRHHRHHYYSYGYTNYWPWRVSYPVYRDYGYRNYGYRSYGYWPRYRDYDSHRYYRYRDNWRRHHDDWDDDDQGEDHDD